MNSQNSNSLCISNETPPFFSVILCTFNRDKLLSRALDSVLNQSETGWEILVVDDGSTDNTFGLVSDYIKRNCKIRYMYHQNRGLARSRNAGIGAATGSYVTFLDSDDYFEHNHLEVRKTVLEAQVDIDLLFGGYHIVGNPYVPDKDDPNKLIHIDECIVDATFVFKRTSLLTLGGFPIMSYAAGNALFQLAQKNGLCIRKIATPTYVYDRTQPDSITMNRKNDKLVQNK